MPPPHIPEFVIPPETPLPNIYPYNRLRQAQATAAGTSTSSSASTPSAKEAVPVTAGGSANASAGPSATPRSDQGNPAMSKSEAEGQRPARSPFSNPSHPSNLPWMKNLEKRESPAQSSQQPGSQASTPSLPLHHRPAPYIPFGSIRSGTEPRDRGPSYGPGSSALSSASAVPTHIPYGLFGGYANELARERTRREREAREREAREREAKLRQEAAKAGPSVQTSPKVSTATPTINPYPRPNLPPSPTARASLPTSNPVPGKPSVSPNPPPASSTTPRPNLPLPSFSSISSRSLPSPFLDPPGGRDRSSSTAKSPVNPTSDATPDPTHRRSLSGVANPSLHTNPFSNPSHSLQSSPNKLTHPTQDRPLYTAPLLAQTPRDSSIQRSPVNRPASATEPAKSPSTQTKPAAPPSAPPQRTDYLYRTQLPGSSYYQPLSGPLHLFGSAYINPEQRREAARQAELRHKADQLRKKEQQDEQREREARERERRLAAGPPPPPPSRPEPADTSKSYSMLSHRVATEYKTATPAPGPGPSSEVMQQVVPQREPRPYNYAAKTDASAAVTAAANAAAAAREREAEKEYRYQPRETKRPRMDVAVEDQAQRRGSMSKSKRRKEEPKSPIQPTPTRDFSQLTQQTKKWPEVTSSPVEAWLKTEAELSRVIGMEVYGGSEWTLAKTGSTQSGCEGGTVTVRVNGAFLGTRWIIRGETGWDDATPLPTTAKLGTTPILEHLGKRGVWGTDVYTDDSDLGLVLVHAGWIRWSDTSEGEKKDDAGAKGEKKETEGGKMSSDEDMKKQKEKDEDAVMVTVRVVPRLVRYTATERNGIQTRGWGNGHDGRSIVVEAIERVTMSKKYLSSSKNRKARMAEYARQRAAVIGLPKRPFQENERVLNQVDRDDGREVDDTGEDGEETMVVVQGRPMSKYRPDLFRSCIDKIKAGDATRELNFANSFRMYEMRVSRNASHGVMQGYSIMRGKDCDAINGVARKTEFGGYRNRSVAFVESDKLVCVEEGLLIQTHKQKVETELYRVEGFWWGDKVKLG